MSKSVVVIMALVVLGTAGVFATQAALEDSAPATTITNESWTPNAGSVTTLDESNRNGAYYSHNVTVYDENSTEMESGTDYRWFIDNGTVKTLSGGDLDGDSSATISYAYRQTSSEQRTFAAMLSKIPQLLGLIMPVGVLIIFFAFIRG